MYACEFEAALGRYADDELPAEKRREVEAHLAACPTCPAELARQRRLSQVLQEAPSPRLSEADKDELKAAVEAEADRAAGRAGRWAKWLTAAAAAVFLFSASQIYLNHGGGRDLGGRDPTLRSISTPPTDTGDPSPQPRTTSRPSAEESE